MNNFEQSNPPIPILASQGRWQKGNFKVTKDMGRMAHASVVVDQYLIIIGGMGLNCEIFYLNFIVFDMEKETCTQVEVSGRDPGPLCHPSACYWKDNQIIVYGGRYGVTKILSEVAIITLSFTETEIKAEWKTIKIDQKIERWQHSAHIYNNQMIVLGGVNEDWLAFQGIHILNLDDFKWEHIDLNPPGGIFGANKSALYGSKIYIFGDIGERFKPRFTFSSLDLESYDWKELPLEVEQQTAHFTPAQEHNGKIYLASTQGTLILKGFDISQEKWSIDLQSKDEKPSNNIYFSLNVYGNQLVRYGGPNGDGLSLFKLDDSRITIQKQLKEENIMKKF